MTRPCARCNRNTVPPPTSSRPRQAGTVYYCGKGLCRGCYSVERAKEHRLWLRPPGPRMRFFTRSGDELDDVAVGRALAGERLKLTAAEIDEAVRRLTAARYSARQIAETLGCTTRTVQRHRTRLRLAELERAA